MYVNNLVGYNVYLDFLISCYYLVYILVNWLKLACVARIKVNELFINLKQYL